MIFASTGGYFLNTRLKWDFLCAPRVSVDGMTVYLMKDGAIFGIRYNKNS